MKVFWKGIIPFCLFNSLLLLTLGCGSLEEPHDSSENLGAHSGVLVNYCGEMTTTTLLAGQTIEAGEVSVANDEDNLYITFSRRRGFDGRRRGYSGGNWLGRRPSFFGAQLGDVLPSHPAREYKMLTLARSLTLAIVFSACASPTPPPKTEPPPRAETPVEQDEVKEEETFMTLFGPMTGSEMAEAAERGDTHQAREQLERFEQEVARLREAADEVPRLGWGDVAEAALRLDRLTEIDQFVRRLKSFFDSDELSEDEEIFLHRAAGDIWGAVDRENTAELQSFVNEHGWPRNSLYGEQAENDAWLLAQHADQNVEFQKAVLEELIVLLEDEETNPRNYAYLYDRVAMNSGELQRDGTQGMCTGPGQWEPQAMEDPEEVEARRESRGLEPMEDYKAHFVDICP